MPPVAALITQFLAFLTVLGDILAIFLAAVFLISYFRKGREDAWTRETLAFFGKNGVLFSFIISLFAIFGSLYYSEIVGFEPCKLCWIQRIFIYPQGIILGLALLKKDERVADYCIALSAIGAAFSAYHQYLQFGGSPIFSCAANGVSCSARLTLEFGYVTIPMMMLTAFILIILFMAAQKKWFWGEKF